MVADIAHMPKTGADGIQQLFHRTRSCVSTLLQVGNDKSKSFLVSLRRAFNRFCVNGFHECRLIRLDGTPELAALVQNNLDLLLQRDMAEEAIQPLAACDTVLVVVLAPVSHRDQVLNTRIRSGKWLPAEEAIATLGEQQPVKWFRWHGV